MERLFSIQQAMSFFGIAKRTLYRWMLRGDLGYVKLNNKRYIRESTINDFIEKNSQFAVNYVRHRRNLLRIEKYLDVTIKCVEQLKREEQKRRKEQEREKRYVLYHDSKINSHKVR